MSTRKHKAPKRHRATHAQERERARRRAARRARAASVAHTRRRRALWAVAAGVAVLALIAVVAVIIARSGDTAEPSGAGPHPMFGNVAPGSTESIPDGAAHHEQPSEKKA